MRAVVQDAYGAPARVLRVAEMERPSPGRGAVLVEVRAASLNSGDWRRVRSSPLIVRMVEGVRRPRNPQLGVDAAGVVVEVGADVTDLHVGDEVYGMRTGALAEFVAGKGFVPKPANLTFEQAAAVPAAACTALQAVRDQGEVRQGQRVLINGAGGGVGTFAIQLARAFGAEVTAVTRTEHLELVRSIGARHVVDYTHEDFSRRGERYDVIIDCAGRPAIRAFRRALAPGGRVVLVAAGKGLFGALGRFAGARLRGTLLKQQVIAFIASPPFEENLLTLKELIEAEKIRPVIDRTYPLERAADALAYVEREAAGGKVVIEVGG